MANVRTEGQLDDRIRVLSEIKAPWLTPMIFSPRALKSSKDSRAGEDSHGLFSQTTDTLGRQMRGLCLYCGAWKWGAFVTCRECGKKPTSELDQARHLLVNEDRLDLQSLARLQERVLAEEELDFDSEELEQALAEVRAVPTVPVSFALLVVLGPVLGFVALAGVAIWLLRG